MAWDAFLSLEGIEGESQRYGHEGQIQLLSFNFGGTNPAQIGITKGVSTGKVSLSTFNATKYTDAASPDLFVAMCSGKHFKEATITLRKSGGESDLAYIVFTLKQVYVDNFDVGGSAGGEDTPFENLSLSFGQLNWSYTAQDEKGSPTGSYEGGWDVNQNQKL